MPVGERKTGRVVIEVCLWPAAGSVAGITSRAERAAVDIVLAVTLDTARRCLAVRYTGVMAGRAGQRRVGLSQRKVAQIVSESHLTELIDVGVATQMLGVTATALARGSSRQASVVACSGFNICCDVFVTVQAQRRLPLAMRSIVTITTFTLDLGVRAGNRPGHDELLDTGSAGSRNEQRGE